MSARCNDQCVIDRATGFPLHVGWCPNAPKGPGERMTNDPTPTVEGLNELRSRAVSWRRNHGGTPEHKQCDPIMRDLLSALAALREQNQELRVQKMNVEEGCRIIGRDASKAKADLDALKQAARQAREAFRLTREYVGEDVLPALPGWAWFDADEALERALLDQGQSDA